MVFTNCNVCGTKLHTKFEDQMGMCSRCAGGVEFREALDEANRKANAAQTLNSNQRQMIGELQQRIDNAIAELAHIADLLADSTEILVGQTDAIRLLNEAIEALSGMARRK